MVKQRRKMGASDEFHATQRFMPTIIPFLLEMCNHAV